MELKIYCLRTEYLDNPFGIDTAVPRFSWKLDSNATGVRQKSYRIVAYDGDKTLWDSGVVESDESQRIRYKGFKLNSRQTVSWYACVTAVDDRGREITEKSDEACFTMGLLNLSDWKCRWIEPEDKIDYDARKPAPYLRRSFQVKKGLKRATLYHTAHGLYEFWLNGTLGTDEKFKPGLTSYYYRIQYQMHDVGKLLHEGENIWAVMLGDGWWRGVTGGTVKNNFGYKLHYFGQLELEYADGSKEIIGSDEQFKSSTGGLLASDMLMGDIFDARKEPAGWKLPGFDDKMWKNARFAAEHGNAELIASRSVPVREKESFAGKAFRDKAGNMVIDFGQNIAGYVRVKFRDCKPGQEIHMVHGEDIDANGCFSVENINKCSVPQEAFQEISYICTGGQIEEYCPTFSVFGFRYLLVEGYKGPIHNGDFTAMAVYSDLDETGDFECSNPLVNQLVKNSRWSQKGNFLDVAVDCPTRERNAWTGDNQVYVRTAAYFMNVYPFYEKWMQDQAIEQYNSGKVGITFPSTSSVHNPEELEKTKKSNPMSALAGPTGEGNIGEDCAGWGDSAAWIPYSIYLCYGDKQILENQYETARKWVDYMLTCAKTPNPIYADEPQYHNISNGEVDADYIYDTRMHYGEWQEPIETEKADETLAEAFTRMLKEGKPKVATAYMCRSAENVAFMANALGFAGDAEKYTKIAARIRQVYERYLIGEDGVIEPGHQAAYVRALAMGLCSGKKKKKVEEQLIREVENNAYHLNTGFLSTPFQLPVLVDIGRADLAFRLLEQTENPSWLHPITLGSTTIPESWNGFDRHEGSLNHYSYGAVCEFLFAYVAGIKLCEDSPGYRNFDLRPIAGGSLSYAKASYESLYGTIYSEWKLTGTGMDYECIVPVNTTATLTLPDGAVYQLASGNHRFCGIKTKHMEGQG